MEILNLRVSYEDELAEELEETDGVLITVLIKEAVTTDLQGSVVKSTSFYGLVKGSRSDNLTIVDLNRETLKLIG